MTILELVALLAAAVALLAAWRAHNDLKSVSARLDRLQSTLYESRSDARQGQTDLENRIASLDLAIQKTTGRLRFDPDRSLSDLFQTEPRAQAVLAAFHIGGCASCQVDENHSLAQAASERGADLDRVLAALNTLPANGGEPDLRIPNVRFEL